LSHRKSKYHKANLHESLIAKLDDFRDSPIETIATEFKEVLQDSYAAKIAGCLEQKVYLYLHDSLEQIVRIFPTSFEERFWFNYYMIESISQIWNRNGQILTSLLIPRCYKEWAHISTFVPYDSKQGTVKSINFVCFPGEDDSEQIDLLDYPFIFHELGHNLFFFNHPLFSNKFEKEFSKIISSLKLRAISDHGRAKAIAEDTWRKMIEYWQPKDNHEDWAHEMAMDLVALWACGPAYLKAFQHFLESTNDDPFLIAPVHPPYAFRVEVLLDACERLNLRRNAKGLEEIRDRWRRSSQSGRCDSLYYALTGPKLRDACITSAIAAFEEISLPRCGKRLLETVERKIRSRQSLNWGTELILGAWLFHEKYGDDKYEKWERKAIQEKLAELRP
jgi:hypothetical protein